MFSELSGETHEESQPPSRFSDFVITGTVAEIEIHARLQTSISMHVAKGRCVVIAMKEGQLQYGSEGSMIVEYIYNGRLATTFRMPAMNLTTKGDSNGEHRKLLSSQP